MRTTGFVDLRLNSERQNDEGFWPSFTDIMMVIVIIFLLAMLTLLLRNMDLVQQLRASLEAERSASSQVLSTSDKNLELNKRILQLEKKAAAIRLRLTETNELRKKALAELESSRSENARLTASNEKLVSTGASLLASNTAIKKQIESLKQKQAALIDELARRSSSMDLLEKQLQSKANEQQQTLARLKASQSDNANLSASNKKLIEARANLLANNAAINEQIKLLKQKQASLINELTGRNTAFELLKQQFMSLSEEQKRALAELKSSRSENIALASSNKKLLATKTNLLASTATITKQIELLKQKQAALINELSGRNAAFELLTQQFQSKTEETMKLTSEQEEKLNRIRKLELEYANLEKKYKYLIRPARSAKGRYVAFVRYQKINDKLDIHLRTQDESEYSPVSGADMHNRLAALQKEHGKNLYVKIIFPDDSGLSYTEAWNLTESLLRMYDYYYQKPE